MSASIALPLPGLDIFAGPRKAAAWLATVFTNAGAAIIANRVIQAGTAPRYIGVGTGTTAAAVGDTALQTEVSAVNGAARVTGTESRVTTTVTNDTYQVTGTWTCTSGTPAITEAGLFDAVTSGSLLLRDVFAAINMSSGMTLTITYGLKFVPN